MSDTILRQDAIDAVVALSDNGAWSTSHVSMQRADAAITAIKAIPSQPDPQVTALVKVLVKALRAIESQAVCVALRHDAAEADDWLHDISNQARNALDAWERSNG